MPGPSWTDDDLLGVHARRESGESWDEIDPDRPERARFRYRRAVTSGWLDRVLGEGVAVPVVPPPPRATVGVPALERVSPTVHVWTVPAERSFHWEHWTLLISDVHYDNPLCRRDLLRWHLDQARARRAAVCVLGDFHCAMEGKFDPRHQKAALAPEYLVDDYLGTLVSRAADLLAEYPDLLWFLTEGNHENSIRRRVEYDLLTHTAREARERRGAGAPPVEVGPYAGWIVWRMAAPGGDVQERVTHYDHGSGLGGAVTRGVIGTARRAVYTPDAVEVWSGHIHEAWYLEVPRERAGPSGTTLDYQQHLCLGTYKEERLAGTGYHVEKGRPPKPLGGWWRRLYWSQLQPAGFRAQYLRTEW